MLTDFGIELNDKAIIVTDRGSNMIAAFRQHNHIFCFAHLLHNVIQKSMQEFERIDDLCRACTKLVKYFKVNGANSKLPTSLKSYTPTRWNSIYHMLLSIEKNWPEIIQLLQEKNDLSRINNIQLSHISEIVMVLQPFEEAFKKLEGDKSPTIHLVCIYAYHLKKSV